MGIPAFLLTVILKWVFVGKYNSQQKTNVDLERVEKRGRYLYV